MVPDFSGYATKAGLKCSDGRTIMPEAFKDQHTKKVPLVWQHDHDDPTKVLGHAILEYRDSSHPNGAGTYAYCFLNESEPAKHVKEGVKHGDITMMSIYANRLVERAKQVFHGAIKEVSLVLAGANPGALIDDVYVQHGDEEAVRLDGAAIIYTGLTLEHEDLPGEEPAEVVEHVDEPAENDKTVQEVYDAMSDDEKDVVHYMVTEALKASEAEPAEHSENDNPEGDLDHKDKEGTEMTRNVFEKTTDAPNAGEGYTLTHSDVEEIKEAWKRGGSMKHAVEEFALSHGIENLDLLFPDPKLVGGVQLDKRRTEWVEGVIAGTGKSPFARVKSMYADLTQEAARARGYIKGNLKKEEWFGLVKRSTRPTTVYKKQKLDRDDIIDATELDVIAFMKAEMQLMLKEEIARAILIGDGRPVEDPANPGEPNPDKIKDPQGVQDGEGIRSILHDHELYAATVNVNIDDANSDYEEVLDAVIRARKLYKGSGRPTFYTTEDVITEMLLLRDDMGRKLYRTEAELAAELRVDKLVPVEVMEEEADLLGIIVNLTDYNVGTDKGGEVTLFDDFDLDYNQLKWLIETRFSGALIKIRSALVIKKTAGANVLVEPAPLAFDPETNTIDYVAQTGVVYSLTEGGAALAADVVITEDQFVFARPAAGYYFANNVEDQWLYEFQA